MSDPARKAEKQRLREQAALQYQEYIVGLPPFQSFAKIPRLNREIIITEKIDGTNAAIGITDGSLYAAFADSTRAQDSDFENLSPSRVYAQSRTRIITPKEDNYGFADWVQKHADILRVTLGPGLHFGEWWGKGINRNYGLDQHRFSLFNVDKWFFDPAGKHSLAAAAAAGVAIHVVPVLYQGPWITSVLHDHPNEYAPKLYLEYLKNSPMGSYAAPGFMQPEGIVVFHTAGHVLFKATIENDEKHKSEVPVWCTCSEKHTCEGHRA